MINGVKTPLKKKGDKKIVSATLDAKKYHEILTKDGGVFKKTRDYFGEGSTIVFQEDGAPGHGYNNRRNRKPSTVHDDIVQTALEKYDIKVVKQPAHSPDLNACDLGFWYALDVAFQEKVSTLDMRNCHMHATGWVESEMWRLLQEAWNELEPRVIWNTFMHRDVIAAALIKERGRHVVLPPHAKLGNRWGTWSPD